MSIAVMIFVMFDSVEKRCSQIIRIAVAVLLAPMSVGFLYIQLCPSAPDAMFSHGDISISYVAYPTDRTESFVLDREKTSC